MSENKLRQFVNPPSANAPTDFFSFTNLDSGSMDFEDEEDPMEQLSIDDSLPPLERIQKYINSDLMLHRLYLIRTLSDSAKQMGFEESKKHLVPLLQVFSQDVEPGIRQALVEQLPEIARFFFSQNNKKEKEEQEDKSAEDIEEGYGIACYTIIPMLAELTTERHPQVRASAVDSLIQLASIIRTCRVNAATSFVEEVTLSNTVQQSDLEPNVLPIIKSLAHDNTEEEHRLEAVHLLGNICSYLPTDLAQKFVLPLIHKLSSDSVFRVRKATAATLGEIAKSLGTQLTSTELLPIFVKLCGDDIWGVRKACAESLVSIGEALQATERYEKLVPIFEKLAADQSRWVKGAAFQNLGPFIAIFSGAEITDKLLKYFTSMVSDNTQGKLADSDLIMHCAYSFPAVLLTVGAARWNELSDTYFLLVKDPQVKVRRTLSCSLHEVARILGPEVTQSTLLPTFEAFLKDLEEVKVGILSHLTEFLSVLPAAARRQYLPLLVDLQTSRNWRFRKLIAKQLKALCRLFSITDTNDVIVQLTIHLCHDMVASVRKAASKGIGLVLNRLIEENSTMRNELERQIYSLANHASFQKRQLYCMICGSLMHQIPRDLFDSKYLPKVLQLGKDHIPNVRLAAAQLLHTLSFDAKYKEREDIVSILAVLKTDKDKDVSHVANLQEKTLLFNLKDLEADFILNQPTPSSDINANNTKTDLNTPHSDSSITSESNTKEEAESSNQPTSTSTSSSESTTAESNTTDVQTQFSTLSINDSESIQQPEAVPSKDDSTSEAPSPFHEESNEATDAHESSTETATPTESNDVSASVDKEDDSHKEDDSYKEEASPQTEPSTDNTADGAKTDDASSIPATDSSTETATPTESNDSSASSGDTHKEDDASPQKESSADNTADDAKTEENSSIQESVTEVDTDSATSSTVTP